MLENESIRTNLNVYETAMQANKRELEAIENNTCFDSTMYTINDENVTLWRKKLADLRLALNTEDFNWSKIVPVNCHSGDVIKKFFELKVQFCQKVLRENGYSASE